MPFEKGRKKTGGRSKNSVSTARKSNQFRDRLKGHGFNYDAEMAQVLKDLKTLRSADRSSSDAIRRIEELKFYYSELKSLLPFMSPKLREKEVEVVEDQPEATPTEAAISTEDILKALGNGSDQPQAQPRTSDPNPVGAGSVELQAETGTDQDLSDLVGEQEEDE